MENNKHIEKMIAEMLKGKIVRAYIHEKEAATFLGMSVQWMQKTRSNQTGPNFCKFGRSVRYSIVELERYVEAAKRNFTGQDKK